MSATVSEKRAYLSSDFGLSLAKRYFSDEEIASFGVFKKGKNVGKPRGEIRWVKCERGGWMYSNTFAASAYDKCYTVWNPVGVERRKGKLIHVTLVLTNFHGEVLNEIGGFIPSVDIPADFLKSGGQIPVYERK
jgi:hypothetical protein